MIHQHRHSCVFDCHRTQWDRWCTTDCKPHIGPCGSGGHSGEISAQDQGCLTRGPKLRWWHWGRRSRGAPQCAYYRTHRRRQKRQMAFQIWDLSIPTQGRAQICPKYGFTKHFCSSEWPFQWPDLQGHPREARIHIKNIPSATLSSLPSQPKLFQEKLFPDWGFSEISPQRSRQSASLWFSNLLSGSTLYYDRLSRSKMRLSWVCPTPRGVLQS